MSWIRFFKGLTKEAETFLRERGPVEEPAVLGIAQEIVADVRKCGAMAALENARKFDAPGLASLDVSDAEWATADTLDPGEKTALELAHKRITHFHELQLHHFSSGLEKWRDGLQWDVVDDSRSLMGQRWIPMHSAGVYVPGGNACYPSSVLMNAIPAQVAGVRKVVVTTPSRKDGTLHPAVLYALQLCGIKEVVKVGGAAAVAMLAFVHKVDKIVGPGNSYVNAAKRLVWGHVGLDGFAGPSEVCVVADSAAHPHHVAVDFLTQIEHAPDNAGFFISTDADHWAKVEKEIQKLMNKAPRGETMRGSLAQSAAFVAKDQDEAIAICNLIAPEHLALAVDRPEDWVSRIRNAGCIMLGSYTPESAGDYIVGPSHTLPTSRAARFGSPVNILDFMKVQSVQMLSQEGLSDLADAIDTIGRMEGFPMHSYGGRSRQ